MSYISYLMSDVFPHISYISYAYILYIIYHTLCFTSYNIFYAWLQIFILFHWCFPHTFSLAVGGQRVSLCILIFLPCCTGKIVSLPLQSTFQKHLFSTWPSKARRKWQSLKTISTVPILLTISKVNQRHWVLKY